MVKYITVGRFIAHCNKGMNKQKKRSFSEIVLNLWFFLLIFEPSRFGKCRLVCLNESFPVVEFVEQRVDEK